ncbi:hypothetical protein OQ496_12660 [Acetobacter suratthaniensis]|uniref:Uncharacterized protein n=1 Tax=Acetobacter suratthaniensis TaxID=1502841 RepID=A0ABS3LPG3_9PROT|nr:hypothetical protein [Acetobacter suratthaniensis]MBO1329251.1 hypothetical protein [Acetobacter suratthaniensis]MCX2567303.1 hypothetical protein [Acetobacter suratthaniensis]
MAHTASSARGAETVTVVCRLPSGLVLDLYDPEDLRTRAGSVAPVMAPPVPRASVRLAGARRDARFHARDNRLLGLGGHTQVDKAFWDAWVAQNPGYLPLKNGLVFAQARAADAQARLAECASQRTGLEGLDPNALPGVTPAHTAPG